MAASISAAVIFSKGVLSGVGEKRAAVVSAFFPFPQGHDNHNTDLEVLQMRWQIRTDDHNGEMGTTFHRVYAPPPVPYWYDPVYPYPYGFYGGVVIIHRGGRWR